MSKKYMKPAKITNPGKWPTIFQSWLNKIHKVGESLFALLMDKDSIQEEKIPKHITQCNLQANQ